MQPLITPNWHIALIHFPIGLIVVGTVMELFSFLGWRRAPIRWAARWMLLIGAILAVPTAFSGLYAMTQLAPDGINALAQHNADLADKLKDHLITQSVATASAMLIVVVWIALSNLWRDRLSILFKLALIFTSGLILLGSHLGGVTVYGHALGVKTTTQPSTPMPSVQSLQHLNTWAELAPPDQTHVVMAGLAAAFACVTLGLAIRAITHDDTDDLLYDPTARIAAAFAEPSDVVAPSVEPVTAVVVSHNHTPATGVARYWFLSAVLLIVTALLGWWIAQTDLGTWDPNAFWHWITDPIGPNDPRITRRLAHLIVGGVLIVDTLILAMLGRFARRHSIALLIFSVPLVLALAAQLWLGILLLMDGPMGAVTGFNPH